MILFGSRAKSGYTKNSDVDLILVSKKFEKMNFMQRAARMYDFWDADISIDFLCYSPDEFKKKAELISIVSEAIKEGIAI